MDAVQNKNVIAVAVDLAETGDYALREGMRLARQLAGSELHVIHVVRTERDMHDARKVDAISGQLNDLLEMVRDHVSEACAPGDGGSAFTQEIVFHVRLGDPAEAIHQAAVDIDADMIVVGTHARRGVEKLLLGSVAERLVRTARVPVLVAHPKDYSDLPRSARPDAARPGQDLHAAGLSTRSHLEFRPRTSHISGLI